jgi:hypothetical protein
MRDLRGEIATARSFSPVSSGYSRRSGNGKAVRAASIVASQQRQRLFDLLSKVSLLSDRSARGCVSAAIFAGTTQELGIALILLSAALGAMLGSTIGFWIGDRYSEARFEEKHFRTRATSLRANAAVRSRRTPPIDWSSASARAPVSASRCTATCCGMAAATPWPMPAMTPALSRIGLGIARSSTPCAILSYRLRGLGTFGADRGRQRFPTKRGGAPKPPMRRADRPLDIERAPRAERSTFRICAVLVCTGVRIAPKSQLYFSHSKCRTWPEVNGACFIVKDANGLAVSCRQRRLRRTAPLLNLRGGCENLFFSFPGQECSGADERSGDDR